MQAEAMDKQGIDIHIVIELFASDHIIIERLSGRRVHLDSGRVYHIAYNPPQQEGIDDISGEPLIHRIDDFPQTIEKRLKIYYQQTEAVAKHYQKLANDSQKCIFVKINAAQPIKQVQQHITDIISSV